ncbi:MAG TPA: phage head closure protein [Novosphingobium sp.]|nr:phage head closure protein [Novosphingobium sp.]
MGPGKLRERVKIRRGELVDNGHGGQLRQWSTIAEPWAEVIGLAGREAVIAHSFEGIGSWRITIRWRAGVLASDQLRLPDGTNLAIAAPPYDPFGNRKWLSILATSEGVEADDGE